MPQPLPIDEHLDAIAHAVATRGGAVVVAQPGAGKTTRVPSKLLDSTGQPVLCTQPRRIAARMSARRVAQERGSSLGAEVGYELRFERKVSKDTRLRFLTEGLALRQWPSQGGGKRVLVLDEFHERHLDADMLLALAAQERRSGSDLSLVLMSATLDAGPIADFLNLPVIESEGRSFPIELRHLVPREGEGLEVSVSRGVRELLTSEAEGDLLVFLPGLGEIRWCQSKLEELARSRSLELLPLHGSLSAEAQDRALRPSKKRKIILATNVAETSLTIEGVTMVIDCGTARVARHSPWTGLSSLQVEAISQASAKQRAGRAGRTSPGQCLRLYSEHELRGRRAFDTPEILRADLASCVLDLAASGHRIDDLLWLDPPPALAKEQAQSLLLRLGALDENEALSAIGARMASLPLHPRLARLVVEAESLGIPTLGARAAALLSERPLRRSQAQGQEARASSTSDVLDDLDLLEELAKSGYRSGLARAAGADVGVAKNAMKIATQILRSLGDTRDADLSGLERDTRLRQALLAGFPDRAARRVRPRGESILLCEGGAVTLSRSSAVLDAEYMLAIDVEARGKSPLVRVASAIDPAWLFDLAGVREKDEHLFDKDGDRVIRRTGIYYGDIAIDEELIVDPTRMDEEAARSTLRQALLEGKLVNAVDASTLQAYRLRYQFVARLRPEAGLPELDDETVVDSLLAMVERPTRLADLKGHSVTEALHWNLDHEQRTLLESMAPTHVSIPGRKRVVVHYEEDRPPWIESRLQDFFGASESPCVGKGQVPLVLHLLAPNRRAVQVTTDLAGFWERHYPALRKQLMRRYPRHKWPEEPQALA